MSGNRRALKAGASILGPVSTATYAVILASGVCSYCGDKAAAVDHIRPLSQGGIEHESNLTPACAFCNGSKNAKLLIEWDPDRVAYGVAHCRKVAAEYKRQICGLALF
jgi:5-methylcytosine-specific restriction endonuclease McrA